MEELSFPEGPMGLAPGLKDESNRLWSELRRTFEFRRRMNVGLMILDDVVKTRVIWMNENGDNELRINKKN
jgi:hypothetical protein